MWSTNQVDGVIQKKELQTTRQNHSELEFQSAQYGVSLCIDCNNISTETTNNVMYYLNAFVVAVPDMFFNLWPSSQTIISNSLVELIASAWFR